MSCPQYVVLEADSGAAGLAICQSQCVDCVVTELDLPDISGFQVLIELVSHPTHPEQAVIVLTHLRLLALDELARKNGALAYLIKSHASGDLLDIAIRDALAAVRVPHG
jgi:CheY-like chemotaxis protein